MPDNFIPAHGGYQNLLSFKKARIVYETFRKGVENSNPAIAANVMIGLTKLTSYLLDQQIRQLEKAFLKEVASASE